MITEEDFIRKYETDKPILEAWGNFVIEDINRRLNQEVDFSHILKINPSTRLKDNKSIISKAFFRGKKYKDPYNDITDKVGARFVVLLRSQVKQIDQIIEEGEKWTFSKDRDFEQEKLANPELFIYQSDHYIVRCKADFTLQGITIPEKTSCEIQVRTLLQHAFSELTHDTIYKPKIRVEELVFRSVAKSMALIEATDDIFESVEGALISSSAKSNKFLQNLGEIYGNLINSSYMSEYEDKFNSFMFDAYEHEIENLEPQLIQEFLEKEDNSYIPGLIKDRYHEGFLYRQPIILLFFYLISKGREKFRDQWPLTENELTPLFSDLGLSL